MPKCQNAKYHRFYQLLATLALFCSRLLQVLTKWIMKIKLDHTNFLENFDRISEFSSKWILISGILSENTKSNYSERYDSLLKMKNHVNDEASDLALDSTFQCRILV